MKKDCFRATTFTLLFLRTPVFFGSTLCVSIVIAPAFGFLSRMSPPIAPSYRHRSGLGYRTSEAGGAAPLTSRAGSVTAGGTMTER
jgi:hypothetical protein